MSYSFAGRDFNRYRPFFPYECKDYSFKVDLEFGELYFTRKLLSFSGKHLPLNLCLKYVQRHVDNGTDFSYSSGFPKGFKTNFHVFLEYSSSHDGCYNLEDADGFSHLFLKAKNTSTTSPLYYDSFGTGLMLQTQNNGGYKVFDDDGNYQEFDSYGRLIKIHKKITSSYSAEQTITYVNNVSLMISSITDNYSRTVSFEYTGSYVKVYYNNNVVLKLNTSNACLTSIEKNIDGFTPEDIIYQTNRVSGITLASGESIEFFYNYDKVNYIQTNIKQDVFSFDYGCFSNNQIASVTNARGIKTEYDFNQEQLVSNTLDNTDSLDFIKINSKIDSCLIKENVTNNEITQFIFSNNDTSITVNGNSSAYSNSVTNNYLQPKKMYLFYAEIDGNLGPSSFNIKLYDYANHLLAELNFTGKTKTLSFPVGICSTTQKQFKLYYTNNSSNHVDIVEAKLVPLIGDFEALCCYYDTGGPVFFHGDTPYYLLKQGTISSYNLNLFAQENAKLHFSDYLINERLFYTANGNNFRFWANDKTLLIDNVGDVFVSLGGLKTFTYSSTNGYIAYTNKTTPSTLAYFYKINGKDDNSFVATRISHYDAIFYNGYNSLTTRYYEEQVKTFVGGSLGYISYYSYDENYSLIELNRNDGYKEKYQYDNHRNFEIKTISHTNINEKIQYVYSYDSDDNLEAEDKLVGNTVQQTSFSYDGFGNLSMIEHPNGLQKGFHYDNVTGERDTNTKYRYSNVTYVTQNNNYIDAENNSFSVNGNAYSFGYDDGKLVSISYNNQNLMSFSYSTETYGIYVVTVSTCISCSNGYHYNLSYDAFSRLVSKDQMTFTYDCFSNLIKTSDYALGVVSPYIDFEYNYYNQVSNIEVEYTTLCKYFSYDIYQRIASHSFEMLGNSIISASYSYYAKPNLEKTIKTTTITADNCTITIDDEVDDFSRLTSQTISIGNSTFMKKTTYHCGGSNNAYTNYMVGAHYQEIVLNPQNSVIIDGEFYDYDSVGNIVSITRRFGVSIVYQIDFIYDAYSRLVRENNQLFDKTITYSYDANGNILSKNEYAYSTSQLPATPLSCHTYSYDQNYPNRLISYDNQSISYDSVGNPTTYRGKETIWTNGTLLQYMNDGLGGVILSYDSYGQRRTKNCNSGSHNYCYIDSQLIVETINNSVIIKYLYSHLGIIGIVLSGYDSSLNLNGIYYFEKNIQQDVIAIRDINHNIKAKYAYDAWGNFKVLNPDGTENVSSSFIGNINPIRYRSYYYDTDLNLYWLTTRYYDPEVGRFISPDHYSYLDYQKLHGLNLYAYSKNNPVMYYDPSGHFDISSFFIALRAAVSTAVTTIVATALAIVATVATVMVVSAAVGQIIGDKDEDSKNLPHETHKLSDGTDVDFYIKNKGVNTADNSIKIYNSYKLTSSQFIELLEWLIGEGYSAIDIDRIRNEWVWHNLAYAFNFRRDAARTVDAFFNSDDINHGIFSWIINNLRWW